MQIPRVDALGMPRQERRPLLLTTNNNNNQRLPLPPVKRHGATSPLLINNDRRPPFPVSFPMPNASNRYGDDEEDREEEEGDATASDDDAMSVTSTVVQEPPSSNNSTTSASSSGSSSSSAATANITLEMLQQHFEKPLAQVAARFGVCTTVMKKICRQLGLEQWPYRTIVALRKSITSMENALAHAGESQRVVYAQQIASQRAKLTCILTDPDQDKWKQFTRAESHIRARKQHKNATSSGSSSSTSPSSIKDEPTSPKKRKRSENVQKVSEFITLDMLRPHFEKPLNEAAKIFCICPTLMKRICRENGLPQWPYRHIAALRKSLASMTMGLEQMEPGSSQRKVFERKYEKQLQRLQTLLENPASVLSGRFTKASGAANTGECSPTTAVSPKPEDEPRASGKSALQPARTRSSQQNARLTPLTSSSSSLMSNRYAGERAGTERFLPQQYNLQLHHHQHHLMSSTSLPSPHQVYLTPIGRQQVEPLASPPNPKRRCLVPSMQDRLPLQPKHPQQLLHGYQQTMQFQFPHTQQHLQVQQQHHRTQPPRQQHSPQQFMDTARVFSATRPGSHNNNDDNNNNNNNKSMLPMTTLPSLSNLRAMPPTSTGSSRLSFILNQEDH